ncbi:MAG: helix-turn-helix domain-containing protein [Bacteroidota bacterium]
MNVQSVDLWTILIIIALAQGLFVLSLMILKRQVHDHNRFLFALLVTILWFQAEFLSIRLPFDVGLSIFYGTRYGSWLVVGPLFFLYIQSATGKALSLKTITLHFSPFLLFTILVPLFTSDILNFRQIHYGMLTPFDAYNKEVSIIQYFYSGIFIVQYVHLLFYLVLSTRYLNAFELTLKGSYSNYSGESFRWFRATLGLMYFVLACATLFLVLLFLTEVYRRHLDYIYVLPMSVFVYLISYKLAGVQWSRPVAHREVKKYNKSSLRPDEARSLAGRVVDYFGTSKPYLNNELRLQDLSSELGIPSHHLSQVFNQELRATFFDFVNNHRITTAKRLIEEKPAASLLEIAFDSGFNNKTSFVNAFKKHAGMTPSSYRKQFVLA